MDTETYNLLNFWVQFVIGIAMVGTLIFYGWQILAMISGVKSQNLLSLVQFLQEPQYREARNHVMNLLESKSFSKWSVHDRKYAALVCSSYGTAGGLLKKRVADSDLIIDGYGTSIIKCYEIILPYIEDMREISEPTYWINFEWIYKKALSKN